MSSGYSVRGDKSTKSHTDGAQDEDTQTMPGLRQERNVLDIPGQLTFWQEDYMPELHVLSQQTESLG